jgi:arylsulfatase A-like enzyme
VGRLLDALRQAGLDRTTWVVFVTDHGPALPRAKSTLYDAGTGIALIIRPPTEASIPPRTYEDLFSGVDLLPTLLDLLGIDVPSDVEGISHARNLTGHSDPVRTEIFTTKTYHDSFDPIRAIRTKDYSYIENYSSRPLLDLPLDIADSAPGRAVAPLTSAQRPKRELYDLFADPTESRNLLDGREVNTKDESIANALALLLNDWRTKTNDVIPSEFAGNRISERFTETYLRNQRPPSSRSGIAADRGIEGGKTRQ